MRRSVADLNLSLLLWNVVPCSIRRFLLSLFPLIMSLSSWQVQRFLPRQLEEDDGSVRTLAGLRSRMDFYLYEKNDEFRMHVDGGSVAFSALTSLSLPTFSPGLLFLFQKVIHLNAAVIVSQIKEKHRCSLSFSI